MQITIVPASTRTGAAVVSSLLARGDSALSLQALYRDTTKALAEFKSYDSFTAVRADVSDASSLDFAGSDAVLAITPPLHTGHDMAAHASLVSANVRDAVERAGTVKRLVLLSSMGAQFAQGVGEIRTNHIAETVLSGTRVPEIIFVRCAYFMENWTASLETLKGSEPFFFSTITPLDWEVPMIAVADIGRVLAEELTKQTPPPSKPHVFELHGPRRYTPLDAKAAFSKALDKDVAVKPIGKDALPDFFGQVFPPEVVSEWVEMAMSFLPDGVMAADAYKPENGKVEYGQTELAHVICEAVKGL